MTTRPNILLIVADQWRGEALGCLGAAHALTPNLDSLAARGCVFAKNFTQGTPCAPARASLFTGQYVMNHRVVTNGVPLSARHPNLARELRGAGYEPALIGYTTTTPDPGEVPLGDARFKKMGDIPEEWRVVAHFEYDGYANYMSWVRQQDPAYRGMTSYDLWRQADGSKRPSGAPTRVDQLASDTRWSTDNALAFLDEAGDKPWVLHLGYFRPHPPFTAPAPYNSAVPLDDVPAPKRATEPSQECSGHPAVAAYIERTQLSHFIVGGEGRAAEMTDGEQRLLRQAYYGLIAEIDAEIGRVLSWLDENGQRERTIIVFTSDHGEQLGDHHLFGKICFYDESYHVPLIIVDPRAQYDGGRGRKVEALSESIDVFPTLMDLLGLPIPASVDGRSLVPILNGTSPAIRTAAHFEFSMRGGFPVAHRQVTGISWRDADAAVLRTDRYKYVHFQTLPPILFDLSADPNELENVADHPEYRDIALDMARQMLTWRLHHADRSLARFTTSAAGLLDFTNNPTGEIIQ